MFGYSSNQAESTQALSMLQRPQDVMPAKWRYNSAPSMCNINSFRHCNRKELMYMLHSRRKAEIEILSGSVNSSTILASYPMLPPSTEGEAMQRKPLLHYLHVKLSQLVAFKHIMVRPEEQPTRNNNCESNQFDSNE